jgi:hypothetical protein
LQAFRGDVYAASLFTAYLLFEPVFTGTIPAFDNFITCREAQPRLLAKGNSHFVQELSVLSLHHLLTRGGIDWEKKTLLKKHWYLTTTFSLTL